MNMNFFQWLRDGVRQSVLMGVSDAVEQIGVPDAEGEVQPALAAVLNGEPPSKSRGRKNSSGGRKRLGKSLKEMNGDG